MDFDPALCFEFGFFKDIMKELRKVDDNIHIRINGLPRANLQAHCKEFCAQLLDNYAHRDRWIQGCIGVLDKQVEAQKKALAAMETPDPRQQNLVAELERKARLMRNESTVDSILRDRTAETIRRRCMLRIPTSTLAPPAASSPSESGSTSVAGSSSA